MEHGARATKTKSRKPRSSEIEELRRRLEEAEGTLRAIQSGEVDALVVSGRQGEQVYTLRDADRPYRRLIEQMNEGALTLDAQGVVLFSNACFAEMLKEDLERVLGQSISRWVIAADQSAFAEVLKKGLEGSAKGEIRLRGREGELSVELSLRQMQADDGTPLVTAIAVDLQERKRNIESMRTTLEELDGNVNELQIANEELSQANEELGSTRSALENERQRYVELFDFAPEGYLVTDPQAVIREANQAASVQLNVPARDLVRTPLVLFVDVHDRRTLLSVLARFISTDDERLDAADLAITMQPRHGNSLVASLKIGAIREADGKLTGLRWLIRDVSALVRAEREVRQLNAELELRVAERTRELEMANLFLQSEIEERKRAESETMARNRELAVLYSISQAAGESLGQDERLKRVLGVTADTLQMDAGGVYLLEPDGETMTLRAARGHTPEFLANVASQKIGEGVLGKAVAEKKPMVVDIADYPSERLAPAVAREGMQTIVALPILWQDHLVGAMILSSQTPRSLAPQELQLLTAIGHSLGIWVRNARLYERVQRELAERRRVEKALRASEEHFRIALANSPITVFSQDRDLRYTWVYNPTLGYAAEPLVGKLEVEVLPESAGRLAEIKRPVLESGASVRREVAIREAGETRYYDMTIEPRRDAEGEIIGIMCAAVDITESRRIQEEIEKLNRNLERQKTELEMANRELESFSYSVSHDLRAPLATIDGFSRLLSTEYAEQLSEQGQQFLRLIRENAVAMQRLIDDLLAFSRSARQALKKEDVAPGDIVAQVLEELRGSYAGRQVEIVVGEMPAFAADPGLLKQVYLNLLSNAIKFTRKREVARIEIGCAPCDGEEESAYFVKDNGVGFDSEHADRLFGVFQRLHSEDDYEGTGVGLAIVERIVKRHGGRVWADAAVGQGATFYFTLPSARLARSNV